MNGFLLVYFICSGVITFGSIMRFPEEFDLGVGPCGVVAMIIGSLLLSPCAFVAVCLKKFGGRGK